jgi:16S rRNA (guanine527-N7)-methyltransferase
MAEFQDAQALARRFNVSRESMVKIAAHVDLLRQWQTRINLVAPSTLPGVWTRHVGDSLQLLQHLPDTAGAIADLGSGAGFPGLTLALVTGRRTHLVESNGKKAAFLSEAVRLTGANAIVHRSRIEEMKWETLGEPVGVVTARALAPLAQLLDYSSPLLSQSALGLFLKGRDLEGELTAAAKSWRLSYEIFRANGDSNGAVLKVTEANRV